MSTAERVKQVRKGLLLSQAELGASIGVTANTVASWEQGVREPDAMNCFKLSRLSAGEVSEFFARRAGISLGPAEEQLRIRAADPKPIEAVIKAIETGFARLEARMADGFTRIERRLSGLPHEPPAPGVRLKKAVRVRGDRHEKEGVKQN